MSGLARICKLYGRMTAQDAAGNVTKYVWDYANDVAVEEAEMADGGERWKASERARAEELRRVIGGPPCE